MQTYVDDPGTTIGGVQRDRRRIITLMVLALRAINVRLAFRKGQLGADVAWVAFGYRIRQAGVQVYVLPETFEDLCKLISQVAASNIVGIKTLRTLAGKLSNIARMLRSWKPFLACFWGALKSVNTGTTGGAPPNTVWRKQIDFGLSWIQAFLQGQSAGITRDYDLRHFMQPAEFVATLKMRLGVAVLTNDT